jgi:hypothetical protein
MSARYSVLELGAYHRADEARLVGRQMQRDRSSIWSVPDPDGLRPANAPARLVLLLREPAPNRCKQHSPGTTADYIGNCLPKPLTALGYQVESAEPGGHRWVFAVLRRPAQ